VRDDDDVAVDCRAPVHGNVDERRELPGESKEKCQKSGLTPFQDPSAQAAVLLCQLAEERTLTPVPADLEKKISLEFVGWYRRLLAVQSREALDRINSKSGALRSVLPTAAAMLEQALNEAGAP